MNANSPKPTSVPRATTLGTDKDSAPALKRQTSGLWLGIVLIIAATVVALRLEGRVWWCQCGQLSPWRADVQSSHNSQHLADPYSLTHVSHGLLLYGLFAWLAPRFSTRWRFLAAIAIEAVWEIIENSNAVIERYRAATISLDYFGDSVANALGDIAFCAIGLLLARRLGLWGSVALLAASELLLLFWIRDNLFLNVLMLLIPMDAIKVWQTGPG